MANGGSHWLKWALIASFASIPLVLLLAFTGRGILPTGGGAVALLELHGAIAEESQGPLGSITARELVEHIVDAREDEKVRAIVLRINSPGGSPAASQEIYRELVKVREAGKPVVVSMGDVAASGGYYVAAAADEIFANPSTMTGSIGVILQYYMLGELYEKIGLDLETVKSGRYKDIGSPERPLSPDERRLLESLLADTFDQFVDAVAEGRGLDRQRVLEIADGRLLTGRQAHALGLVDHLGNLEDAIDRAAELAGLGANFPVIEYRRKPSLLESLLYAKASELQAVSQAARAISPLLQEIHRLVSPVGESGHSAFSIRY